MVGPAPVSVRVAHPAHRHEERGVRAVPLDPQLQALRDQRERDRVPPLYEMSLAEARAADLASIRAGGGNPEPVRQVTDLTIPGPAGELPLRLYRPAGEGPLPVLLYFFGGGPRLAGQLLVYPNTDQLADDEATRAADDPFLFNRHSVAWYRRHYLADPGDAASPLASPLRAESLAGLPPALVITAEYDPLRDQGEAYARRLAAEGVPVDLSRYSCMAHGFFTMAGTVDASREAIAQAASQVRAWLAPAGT